MSISDLLKESNIEPRNSSSGSSGSTGVGSLLKDASFENIEPTPAPTVPAPTPEPVKKPGFFERTLAQVRENMKSLPGLGSSDKPKGAKSMVFPVGEGLDEAGKKKAKEQVQKFIDIGSEAPSESIKFPFMRAGISEISDNSTSNAVGKFLFQQNPLIGGILKGIIELPEKSIRTLGELTNLSKPVEGYSLYGGHREEKPTLYQIPSYAETSGKNAGDLVDQGVPPTAAAILSAAQTSGHFAGDALMYSGFLEKGATALAEGAAIPTESQAVAYDFLGRPKTLADAEKAFKKIQFEYHPDIAGEAGSKISAEANRSIAILRSEGIPTTSKLRSAVDTIFNKPVSEIFSKTELPKGVPPNTPIRGLLESSNVRKVIRDEVSTALETQTAESVSRSIQLELGASKETADIIVREVAANPTINPDVIANQLKNIAAQVEKDIPIVVKAAKVPVKTATTIKTPTVTKAKEVSTKPEIKPTPEEQTLHSELANLRSDVLTEAGTKEELATASKRIQELEKQLGNKIPTDDQIEALAEKQKKLSYENVKPSSTPEEFAHKLDQLNKYGQAQRILRRTRGLRKGAAGVFMRGKNIPKEGEIRLQNAVVENPREYMSTLAHELGHATENAIVGSTNTNTLRVFGENIDPATRKTLMSELKAVTLELEGEFAVASNPYYYNRPTELLARFLQKMFESPGNLEAIAPTALKMIYESAASNPILQEYLEAAEGAIDKAPIKFRGKELKPSILPDFRQTLQKQLGERNGNRLYGEIVSYRAMKERAKGVITKFLKTKFKTVKDDPALLFRAAEAIKVTKNGLPEFGTRDFANAKDAKEAFDLMKTGFKPVIGDDLQPVMDIVNGEQLPRYARTRYTPEQGKAFYEALSPEGQKLVDDFTATLEESKDLFNREQIKATYEVNGNIEGWVHRFFKGEHAPSLTVGGTNRLKFKQASTRKHREGNEGYVEDFHKAMSKALVDLEGEKAYNDFVSRVFPMVTKPLATGAQPDPGWIQVQGNLKRGVGTRQETKMVVIENGKMVPIQQVQYQMPIKIYRKFELMRGVQDDMSKTLKVINSLNRYWQANVLFHLGSAATNFISGGMQYGAKIATDFYTELLTGNFAMEKTRSNLYAMIRVLSPKGWDAAPDWVYGGDLSNFYGQFTEKTGLDTVVDTYADKALKVYGIVERYWKKVIATAEGVSSLENLSQLGKDGLRLPSDDEREMLAELNREVDLFAYDYDNVPLWLEEFGRNPAGAAIKPFTKYPYKYMKMVSQMVSAPFDPDSPWQERLAKLLAISTLIGGAAGITQHQRNKQETPEGGASTPAQVSPRGQLYVGTAGENDERERFVRTSKYPFFNIANTAMLAVNGDWEASKDSVTDMVGSVAPAGQLAVNLLGYTNKYQTYTPVPVVVGDTLASFVPGTRILNDAARFFDSYQRQKQTFGQSFGSLVPIPVDDESLRAKLHGKQRSVQVPIEGDFQAETTGRRTTADVPLKNYKQDILLGFLSGIYSRQIDPDVTKAFVLREQENQEKKAQKLKDKIFLESL